MKRLKTISFFLTMLLTSISYTQSVSSELVDIEYQGRTLIDRQFSSEFQEQLQNLALESVALSGALMDQDSLKVKDLAKIMMGHLFHFDERVLRHKSNLPWYYHKIKMALRIKRIYNAETLRVQKIHFDAFNRELYKSIVSYGGSGGKLYYLGCFKAFDNHSGYWFSEVPKISNPYLNYSDANCGFIAEKIR